MQEAVNEWLIMDEQNLKFHIGQYEEPYRSTVKFLDFLKESLSLDKNNYICDLGCGAGAVLDYILSEGGKIFKKGEGIDLNPDIVKMGNKILGNRGIKNCELMVGDIFHLDSDMIGKYDGVISLQTFNILSDYKGIADVMCSLKPSWIAFSTLGFEALIDYNIKLFDYTKEKDGECAEVFYNIYSLPRMEEYFKRHDYSNFRFKKFEIDIDLPRSNRLGRGTYTVKTESGKRIQISGGMMMPWYFVFVRR